jgi:hypothetical protein
METKTFLRVTGAVAAALWIGSLFLPALATCPGANEQWYDGYYLLLFGMFGVSFGILGWYANIPFIAAVAMLLRGTVPNIFLSGVALVLALSTFNHLRLAPDEGHMDPVCARGPGFWMWLCAVVIVFSVSAWTGFKQTRTST